MEKTSGPRALLGLMEKATVLISFSVKGAIRLEFSERVTFSFATQMSSEKSSQVELLVPNKLL
jgi:hypothetical protein